MKNPAKEKSVKVAKVANVRYFSLYRFATKLDMLMIFVSLTSSVVAGLAVPLGITLVADIFHLMVTHETAPKTNEENTKFLEALHKFCLHYSVLGLVIFLSLYMSSSFIDIAALNQTFQIKEAYLRAALHQDMSYFDQQQTGDFASKMSDDILKLEDGIGSKVSTFVYNTTGSASCIVMAFCKGWKLTLLCLLIAPVTFIVVLVSGLVANRFYKQEAVQTGIASAVAEEVISSIRTVYAYSRQEKEIERYSRPLALARQIYIKKEIFTGLAMSFLAFGMFCSYGSSFYFGAYLMVKEPHLYNANVMFSVFFGVVNGLVYFGIAGSLVSIFGSACGAAAQIFHLIENKPIINPYDEDRGIKPQNIIGDIKFNNVSFYYPARPDVMVLKNVSLSVASGQSVALVGHSGCGKSSIIQLITRYYDVVGGTVRVDGHDVRELSVRWLRAQVGLVRQEPVLFNTTVRENIRYGRQDASDADIEAAANQANAHQFILKLPKGYNTLVGERGASLSGGQKQRIAIARALVRNPRILLLDEATSALDTASEKEVQIALEKASKGRTIVVVAHRLSTIRNVNLIYVMKDGVIVEKGTHVELVKMKGLYHSMVNLQEPEPIVTETKTKDIDKLENHVEDREPDTFHDEEEKVKSVSFGQTLALNAPEWKLILVGCGCGFIVGFTMPLVVVAFGYLFGSLSNTNPEVMLKKVGQVSMVCVGMGLAIGFSTFIQAVCFGIAGAHLTERLRRRMFAHILRQDVTFFDHRANSTGALCAKLSAEAAHVRGATGQRISSLVQCVGTVCLSFALALVYEWRVALVALIFVPFILPVMYYQAVTTAKMSMKSAKAVEISTQIAIEAVSNIRTVAALGREEAFVAEFVAVLARAMPLAKRTTHLFGIVTGLSRAMFNFMNATALTYGGHLIVYEQLAYEKILVTTQSIQMAAGQVHEVFSYTPDFQKGKAAAARVLALLHSRPTIENSEHDIDTGFVASGDINFKEVEFRYPNRPGVTVLQGLNFQVQSGKTVALVGRSGSGKSTVIQLLLRFYDPITGVVSLDGIPLPLVTTNEVRGSFGLVSQEPVLFDLTVAENIAYGQASYAVSREEIIDAAKQANVHNFVVAMPEGYETNLGKKGTQLSGGQKQRVAIARALIRKPQILLLDEATSALDTESEKVVKEALDAAKAGRTCVTIAHRLSTVRDADAICVVREGRVAEQGTHQELMNLKRLYYEMYTRSQ